MRASARVACAFGGPNARRTQNLSRNAPRSWLRFRNSFVSQHGRLETPRRRADRARAVHKAAGTCANVPGAQGVDGCRSQSKRALTALHCSLALRRCATAAKHVWTSRTALLRCSRLAARSRPTTRSTRGSWRGLTHDLSVLATRGVEESKEESCARTTPQEKPLLRQNTRERWVGHRKTAAASD